MAAGLCRRLRRSHVVIYVTDTDIYEQLAELIRIAGPSWKSGLLDIFVVHRLAFIVGMYHMIVTSQPTLGFV